MDERTSAALVPALELGGQGGAGDFCLVLCELRICGVVFEWGECGVADGEEEWASGVGGEVCSGGD